MESLRQRTHSTLFDAVALLVAMEYVNTRRGALHTALRLPTDISAIIYRSSSGWTEPFIYDRAARATLNHLQCLCTTIQTYGASRAMSYAVAAVPLLPVLPADPTPTNRLKLNELVDSTMRHTIDGFDGSNISGMYARLRKAAGALPAPGFEPTSDRLAAIRYLVAMGKPPAVDFALLGPFGQRLSYQCKFAAAILNSETMEVTRNELPGPRSVNVWSQCWDVFTWTPPVGGSRIWPIGLVFQSHNPHCRGLRSPMLDTSLSIRYGDAV